MKTIVICLLASAALLLADSVRDNSANTVFDRTTQLMWQDDTAVTTNITGWQGAINYCEALTLGGYGNWRLPNKKELQSIVEPAAYAPAIDPTFANTATAHFYWSSTTDDLSGGSAAWYVDFNEGGTNSNPKTAILYVRCVRD